jgi:hypothetical protein
VRCRSELFHLLETSGVATQQAFPPAGNVRCDDAAGISTCWKRQVWRRSRHFHLLETSGAATHLTRQRDDVSPATTQGGDVTGAAGAREKKGDGGWNRFDR